MLHMTKREGGLRGETKTQVSAYFPERQEFVQNQAHLCQAKCGFLFPLSVIRTFAKEESVVYFIVSHTILSNLLPSV